jgi:D-amino peptidase
VCQIRLNGVIVGEPGYSAAVAGHYGVPVVLVTGDDTMCAEVEALMPWTERVTTKWAQSTFSARNLTPKASQKRIREGARRALSRLSEMKPLIVEKPVRIEVDFAWRPATVQLAADIPGVERIDGRRLAYTGADMLEVERMVRVILNAGRRLDQN